MLDHLNAVNLGGGAVAPNTELVAQVLAKGDKSSQRIAQALRTGEIDLEYLNIPNFQVNGRYMEGSGVLQLNGNQNWAGSDGLFRAAITAGHEGQHWLDDAAGIATQGMKATSQREAYFEARAFLREQKIADSLGKSELGTLNQFTKEYGSRTTAWEKIKEFYGLEF